MTIVSSQIVRDHNRGNGTRSVHEEHTDDLGKIHERRYHCALDYDVDTALIDNAPIIDFNLKASERERVKQQVIEGVNPSNITVIYISENNRIKNILRGLMRGEAENVIQAAIFADTLTDNKIDNLFSINKRNRIRSRISHIITNQTIIEADKLQQEEI